MWPIERHEFQYLEFTDQPMAFQPYIKTAREIAAALALAQENEAHRESVLNKARETMARFEKANPAFNRKYFATMVVQIAFPHDSTLHPPLIADLLKKSN